MTFLTPLSLALLVPVAATVTAYLALQRRRRRYAVRFTNLDLLDQVAPQRPGWRRHLTAGAAGLAAVALVLGLAQPAVARTVATEQAVIVLAIDTSTSMEATDVSPSRIAAARAEAEAFVEDLPDDVLVGLVAFDGTARLVASPTEDHDAVAMAIANLQTDRGTAGGDAIETALDAIDVTLAGLGATSATTPATAGTVQPASTDAVTGTVDDAPAATIVMLSDGETTVGLGLDAAAVLATEASVPVSTITYGTDSGSVTVEGQTVAVPPATEAMAELAAATGGEAFSAASATELASIYEDIGARIATTTETRELTLAFVAAGLVFLLAAAIGGFVWTGRFM